LFCKGQRRKKTFSEKIPIYVATHEASCNY